MPASQQLNTLRDGQTQASFSVMGVPAPVIMEMEASNEINLLTMTQEDFSKLLKAYPYWDAGRYPQGHLQGRQGGHPRHFLVELRRGP